MAKKDEVKIKMKVPETKAKTGASRPASSGSALEGAGHDLILKIGETKSSAIDSDAVSLYNSIRASKDESAAAGIASVQQLFRSEGKPPPSADSISQYIRAYAEKGQVPLRMYFNPNDIPATIDPEEVIRSFRSGMAKGSSVYADDMFHGYMGRDE